MAANFIHHNQYFKGDREALMHAMEDAHKATPNKTLTVKKVLEDGNHVMTFSEIIRSNHNSATIAVIHIFRIENDKIVELWDVGQEVLKDSPNKNGIF
ncbi:nuclear transport factor 2 family protein [Bdellovibrio bacteriovorus]|uniref:nuclear transport factor 2 family protein n=1 Tax=Bdellovibrio bacteriovorus TaxID=959 RepID=UPI0035A5EF4C